MSPICYFAATHQKGFIVYLVASHLSYFLTLRIYDIIWPLLDENLMWSYRRKVAIFAASFAFLFVMVYYYYRHFIHCDQFGKKIDLLFAVLLASIPPPPLYATHHNPLSFRIIACFLQAASTFLPLLHLTLSSPS